MNGLINLLILYIIISLIVSAFRKKNKAGRKVSSQQKKTLPTDIQATFEKYVGKLEKYFEQSKYSEQKAGATPAKERKVSSSGKQDRPLLMERPVKEAEQQVLVSDDTELENLLSQSTQQLFQEIPRSQSQRRTRLVKPPAQTHESLLSFDKRRGYLQGIILSEILGPPVSKRSPRFRR